MAKRMIFGRLIDIGDLPWNVKALGFRDADDVSRIAHKFGRIVAPMKLHDVIESFEDRAHNK